MEESSFLQKHTFPMPELTGNQLKLIALCAMPCDHVGKQLLPQVQILQIIGRLAFPLFAYMIAEGCRYTRNRHGYLLRVAGLGLGCQLVYFVAERSLYQCILVTFSLSIGLIYVTEYGVKSKRFRGWISAVTAWVAVWFGAVVLPVLLPRVLPGTDFRIDYGFWGILLPVLVYFAPAGMKIPLTAAALVPLCLDMGGYQWYSLGAVLLLLFYRGRRGTGRLKHLFFVYYPLHLALIWLIGCLI